MKTWRVVGINLYGVVPGIRAFLPIMTDQGEGHIVNTASMAGLLPMPGAAPYNAAKHAVVAISESLYLELKAVGSPVEVSVLCPGFVNTRLMVHEPETVASPMGNLMTQIARDAIAVDIPAAQVAGPVADAVKARRFWILTHRSTGRCPSSA